MRRADPTDWTISSVKSGHLTSVFCGQPTSTLTQQAGMRLRYIKPRCPEQNGKVERSHRVDE